jgi:hypothetical protein
MSQADEKNEIADETADERAPYEAPRFECEELYEVLALACGKVTGNPRLGCHKIISMS